MRESKVEKHLKTQLKKHGGAAYKFKSPGRRRVPDRLMLFGVEAIIARLVADGQPRGQAELLVRRIVSEVLAFAELKRPNAKLTPHYKAQLREHDRLRKLGLAVHVLDSTEAIDAFLAQRYRRA